MGKVQEPIILGLCEVEIVVQIQEYLEWLHLQLVHWGATNDHLVIWLLIIKFVIGPQCKVSLIR